MIQQPMMMGPEIVAMTILPQAYRIPPSIQAPASRNSISTVKYTRVAP
jgi:hypothetical protein